MQIISNGRKIPVKAGLIDSKGMFCLLLDADETKHYRFSDETECITELVDEITKLEQLNEKLVEDCERLEARHKKVKTERTTYKQRCAGLEEQNERLREKLKEVSWALK